MRDITILFITAIGYSLRVIWLNRPIFADEAYSYLHFVRPGLLTLLTDYKAPNNHVFHNLLMWLSTTIGSPQEIFIRFPVFMAGVLLTPLTYQAGRRLYNDAAGIFAAAIVAVSLPLMEYSANARGYMIILCIFAAQIILACDLLYERKMWKWASFSILSAIGFYTIPVMVFPIGAVALWMSLEMAFKRRWGQILRLTGWLSLGAAMTIIAYTPIIWMGGLDQIIGNRYVSGPGPDPFLEMLWRSSYELLIATRKGLPITILAGFGIASVLSIVLHRQLSQHRLPIGVISILWFLIVVLLAQRVGPWRTMTHFIVLFALHAGAGLALLDWNRATRRFIAPVVILIVGVIVTTFIMDNRWSTTISFDVQPGAREAAAAILSHTEIDDTVVLATGFPSPFEYYIYLDGNGYRSVPLNMPPEEALSLAEKDSFYLLTINGDPYTRDRILEAIQIDINDPRYSLEPLTEGDPMILNRFVVSESPDAVE